MAYSHVGTAPPKTIDWKLGMSVDEQNQVVELDEENLAVIVFKWNGNHNVYQFPDKDSFENCDFSQATILFTTAITSSYIFRARSPGTYYFGCEVGSHCRYGQKLTLQVTGAFLQVHQIYYCKLYTSACLTFMLAQLQRQLIGNLGCWSMNKIKSWN